MVTMQGQLGYHAYQECSNVWLSYRNQVWPVQPSTFPSSLMHWLIAHRRAEGAPRRREYL